MLTISEHSHLLDQDAHRALLSERAVSWQLKARPNPGPGVHADLPPVKDDPAMLLAELLRQEGMQAVKRFFVFMPSLNGAYEAHMERTLMGDSYDSAELGKVPADVRDRNCPYDWPVGT